MTDFEIMTRAKQYIDKMANGINPLTGESIPSDELLNNVRISRCLFYVSGILGDLIDNGEKSSKTRNEKPNCNLNSIDLSKIELSETPIALSEIARRINTQVDTSSRKKITYSALAQLLISLGFLEEIEGKDGKRHKKPTENGKKIGISVMQKTDAKGKIYNTVVYNLDAQKFVIDIFCGNM